MTKEEQIKRLRDLRNQIDEELISLGESEPQQSDFHDVINLRKSDFRNYKKDA
jgi:hypothetical protein